MPKAKQPNPLLENRLQQGDRWQQINSIRAGASLATCGRNPEVYNPKPYGMALLENFPHLQQCCEGTCQDDCQQLIRTAINRGSVPMAIAALLVFQGHSTKAKNATWKALSESDQQKLQFLLELGQSDPVYRKLFVMAS